jgi:anti-anti-sigma factor
MIDGFEARLAHLDGGAEVIVRGEIDIATAGQLRTVLIRSSAISRHLIIDMSRVEFMDAAGLHVLEEMLDRVRSTGSIELVGASKQVDRLLTISGLADQLQTRPPGRHLSVRD